MHHRQSLTAILSLALTLAGAPAVADGPPRSSGPSSGSLLVIGGGGYGPDIREQALRLSGGAAARWVAIPTAAPDREIAGVERAMLPAVLRANYTVLHTRDRAVADGPEFVAPLRTATAVWLEGGRQYRLVDAYAGTRTEREIAGVLARGGLVAGTSADATILGSYLVRGAPSEDNHILMSPGHEVGFGFLHNVAVDQHVLVRRRSGDLAQVVAAHPALLGIGIDEATAILVQGDRFTVLGRSLVWITDGADHEGRPFYPVLPGERFDLATWRWLPRDEVAIGPGLPIALAPGSRLTGPAPERAWAGRK